MLLTDNWTFTSQRDGRSVLESKMITELMMYLNRRIHPARVSVLADEHSISSRSSECYLKDILCVK